MTGETAGKVPVAFQGERGAFSEEAIGHLLGSAASAVPCRTFEDLFGAIPACQADLALVPLENTLAGHIARCYELLYESDLAIRAEVVLAIHHCVIGCPGAQREGVRIVKSHPVALAQCENFFRSHPDIKRVVADDTAGSVRDVVERGDPSVAAIAGEHAARVYGAEVLLRNVEDYPENYTRFALLAAGPPDGTGDKRSLVVKLKHQPGGLHAALAPFAHHEINLLNLVCRPLKGRPWEYLFFIDLAATDETRMAKAMRELEEVAEAVRVLGVYASAEMP